MFDKMDELVNRAIRMRDALIDNAILDLVVQGSKPADITIEYNAYTQIIIVRDKVKGSSKVIQPAKFNY